MIDRIPPVSLRPTAEALSKNALQMQHANGSAEPVVVPQGNAVSSKGKINATPVPVDAGKVATIRDAIANGSYSVDRAATAASILKFYRG